MKKLNESFIEVKKSKFIGYIYSIESIDEVAKIISNLKEEHKKDRHIVYAYKVGGQEKNYSDKEPSGTTRGLLDLIHYKNLDNTLIVVIRYFGGTLLGTGGLVRAYAKSVQEGLACSQVITKHLGVCIEIGTDYNGVGKLQYLFGQKKIPVLDAQYAEDVKFRILVKKSMEEETQKAVTEATNGKASVTVIKELYYALLNGEVLTFDD